MNSLQNYGRKRENIWKQLSMHRTSDINTLILFCITSFYGSSTFFLTPKMYFYYILSKFKIITQISNQKIQKHKKKHITKQLTINKKTFISFFAQWYFRFDSKDKKWTEFFHVELNIRWWIGFGFMNLFIVHQSRRPFMKFLCCS